MGEWMLAVLAWITIVGYWILCRKNALIHQAKASQLLAAFLADESNTDDEKESLYALYRALRTWYVLPLAVFVVPVCLFFELVSGPDSLSGSELSKSCKYVLGVMVQMYIAKNPILSVLSLSCIAVILLVFLVIGSMLNGAIKLTSLPPIALNCISRIGELRIKASAH